VERLRKKLNSSRGASILIALLFLLLCMMVAASILMAAASNAGKLQSNRKEHQKYLILSSALQLVADELEEAVYTGKYTILTSTQTTTVTPWIENADGIGGWDETHATVTDTRTVYTCEQLEGELHFTSTPALKDKNVFSLLSDGLDKNFANYLKSVINSNVKTLTPAAGAGEQTLTVTVGNVDGIEIDPVTVKLSLRDDYRILLNASMPDDNDPSSGQLYTMKAELLPVKVPNFSNPNASDIWKDREPFPPTPPAPVVVPGTSKTTITYSSSVSHFYPVAGNTTTQVTWKLKSIQKGAG